MKPLIYLAMNDFSGVFLNPTMKWFNIDFYKNFLEKQILKKEYMEIKVLNSVSTGTLCSLSHYSIWVLSWYGL